MRFLDKVVILKDSDNSDVCIFVDKIAYIKELDTDRSIIQIGMVSGTTHTFNNETICSFLRMIMMGSEGCDDVQ